MRASRRTIGTSGRPGALTAQQYEQRVAWEIGSKRWVYRLSVIIAKAFYFVFIFIEMFKKYKTVCAQISNWMPSK